MPRREVNHLKPLSNTPLQAYFDNRLQLADVIDQILRQIGPAELVISTFSTSDAFIRRLHRLKNEGLVLSCSLFVDLKASRKTVLLAGFIKTVFDAVFLCENHSKVVLLSNGSHHVTIVTSQNQTQGNRMECGIISTDNAIFNYISDGFIQLKNASLPLGRL